MVIFDVPIPVITPLGDAYAVYVYHNGMFEDDEWTCAMMEDGQVRHFVSSQIKLWNNATYSIKKNEKESSKKVKTRSSPANSNKAARNKKGLQKVKKNPQGD
jgi:hypothetical protein